MTFRADAHPEVEMTRELAVVLLSGPIGVGKTSVRDVLSQEHGFASIRSSAYLRELSANRNNLESRGDLQVLGDQLDQETDYRWVVEVVAEPALRAAPQQTRWLFDAVRKVRQVTHFRATYGKAVLHVHLAADEKTLKTRYDARAASLGDPTPYEQAIMHDNERCARALVGYADLVLQTDRQSAQELADRIFRTIAARD
ncbi:AAA family ATPase [Aquabacterium humicola]|uniref:AAA family ATPase n=1 Tax=Aquabacterium humicola TaxID=3237377 RepID=UPI00254287A7|nr:AAA family ATPase [Rubrivivax pictus]